MDNDNELIPNTSYHKDKVPVGRTPNNAPPFNVGRDTMMHGPKNLNQVAETQSAPSQISLESSPASWLAYLAKNPEQQPLGVQVNHEGIILTINLGIYLRISWMGISNPKGIKLSKEEEWTYSWRHYVFWCTVICVLTQPGHYEARIAHLKLTVNPRSTNSLYREPFDNGNDVEVDDTVQHLAKNRITLDWATHDSVIEFAWSYIRDRMRHSSPQSRVDSRLNHIYWAIYQTPPWVEFFNPNAPLSAMVEIIPHTVTEPTAV
jgi:hypothetical protein